MTCLLLASLSFWPSIAISTPPPAPASTRLSVDERYGARDEPGNGCDPRVGVGGYDGAGELADSSPSSSVSKSPSSSKSCGRSEGELRLDEGRAGPEDDGSRVSDFDKSRNVGFIVDKRNLRERKK